MKQIILIRHGQAEHQPHNRIGGWSDVNLTELGIKQAQAVAQRLEELKGTYKIYSSDLNRAKQTAEIICKQLEVTPTYAFELREHNPGNATGMTREESAKQWQPVPDTHIHTLLDWRPNQESETIREFFSRVTSFMDKINEIEEQVIIVSHGGTIHNIIRWWIGTPISDYFKFGFVIANTSLSVLDTSRHDQRIIERLNDTTHYTRINKSNSVPYPQ